MAREHIYERADGKAYVVQFRQSENAEYPRVFSTFNFDKLGSKKAAKAEAKLFEAREMEKRGLGELTHRSPKITFKEAGENWYANGIAIGEDGEPSWRASTASDYASCLRRLNAAFASVQIAELTKTQVDRWAAKLRQEVSKRTLQKLRFVGNAVYLNAQDEFPGFTHNPFRRKKKPGGKRPEGPRKPSVYSTEEGWAIVRAAETTQDAAMLLLLWRGGLRRGEIPPLRVENVDFSDRHIRVHENYVHGVVTSPKGKSERFVPLNKKVATALDAMLKERGDPPGDALLFPGDDGLMLDPRLIYIRFKNAVAIAGVRELRLHDLRHTYCSYLASRGVSPWEIQENAGHANLETTQTYVDLFGPQKKRADTVDAAYDEEDEDAGEPGLDNRKVGELTIEELAEALARIQARGAA